MSWRRIRNREDELERELRSHLDLEAEELAEDGVPAQESRHAANRALGNVPSIKEDVRLMSRWTLVEAIVQELRFAARTLRKSPGFAITAILTLALGIGASTAVFTVVDSVLLKPLAFHDSGRLVACWERLRFFGDGATGPNPRHVEIWRLRSTAFSGLTFFRQLAMGLTFGKEHPRLTAAVVTTPTFFDVLQVRPMLGRTFVAEDGTKGHDNVAVLTYSLWQELFHGDRSALGALIKLGDVPRQIVGVLPPDFHFPSASVLRAFHRGGQAVAAVS